MAREASLERITRETAINVTLNLDGSGKVDLDCPIGFLNHCLETFAKHGLFDIELRAKGDLHVDQHHLVEDIGIVLGMAFARALGEKRGISRVGSCLFPMDESLARAVVDLGGRAYLVFNAELLGFPLVSGEGSFQVDTVEDFFLGFATNAQCNVHIDVLRGRSDHHKIEAIFKALARALREACQIDAAAADSIPSTKGVLA